MEKKHFAEADQRYQGTGRVPPIIGVPRVQPTNGRFNPRTWVPVVGSSSALFRTPNWVSVGLRGGADQYPRCT